jgi:hypothetical protein
MTGPALPRLLLGTAVALSAGALTGGGDDASWRTDPAWYDGRAECAVYDATREIYGTERTYVARAYTNKQRNDPETGVKSAHDEGTPVFKHHWSERVPTENYDYDFSTVTFSRTDDLSLFRLTAATQEDCGPSFKQVQRRGDRLEWLESVYFPGAGTREGSLAAAPDVVAEDQLSLVLRDFPFEEGAERALRVLPSQKSPRRVSFRPDHRTARWAARETLDLPVGRVEAHRVDLVAEGGRIVGRYWFAADGTAPWLHALVRYEGPGSVTYRLRELERRAYWERD